MKGFDYPDSSVLSIGKLSSTGENLGYENLDVNAYVEYEKTDLISSMFGRSRSHYIITIEGSVKDCTFVRDFLWDKHHRRISFKCGSHDGSGFLIWCHEIFKNTKIFRGPIEEFSFCILPIEGLDNDPTALENSRR